MTKHRLWLIIPWAVFAVLAIGWVSFWHIVVGTAEQRLAAFTEAQNAQGARAEIGRVVRHGFPVMMRLELRDVSYAPARGGWRAASERIDLHLSPFNLEHIILRARTPIAITRANGHVTNVTADAMIASWRTRRGTLAQAGIEARHVTLDDPAEEGVMAAQDLVLNIRPDPRGAGQYQVAFDARAVTLPRPVRGFESFGLGLPTLRALIVVEHGDALLTGSQDDPLGPWREAGGQLRFDALALAWGPLIAEGHGTGGLDAQRRIRGDVEFPIERPGPIFSALANGPEVDEDARRALAILAAGFNATGEGITLDVEAADGVMRLEGLPVRRLPPVY